MIKLKPKESCRFDQISLGEVMLRLDPGEGRIRTTRRFHVWEGGGEYNVARGLRRCFGLRTAVVTAFAENEIGYLLEDLILQGGVDTRFIKWLPYDGIGRTVRNGLNFTERGFGVRGAIGTSDRANSAASLIKPGEIDWEYIFGECGVRWFHTGGVFAALSPLSAAVTLEAVQVAKKYDTIVSYDLNYRPSLWKANGGLEKAQEVNRAIASHIDVMIGNEEDFIACLGFEVDGNEDGLTALDLSGYQQMQKKAMLAYPNFRLVATTLRTVKTATKNDWTAVCRAGVSADNSGIYQGMRFVDLEILDRVGGGDSFASGLIFGLLSGFDFQTALDYGVCHGALAMTTSGDTSMASRREVENLMKGKGARVER
ncbi:MAG: sugar kinase [Lachnospiraceae bacterium]|nr:sugar kinase [Lachnospiraceae bacterium]